jgi:twitching motility protein PilT
MVVLVVRRPRRQLDVETTDFSGAPQGDEPNGSEPDRHGGSDLGFFAPAPAPDALTATLDAPTDDTPQGDPEPPAQPVDEQAPPSFDPTSFDAGSLLAPAESTNEAATGLPMSLTIAAEEAATVDVDAEPEPPQSFDYQAFHDQEPAADPVEDASASTEAVEPAEAAADADFEPADDDYDPFADLPPVAGRAGAAPVELADSEAGEGAYSRVTTEPTLGGEDIVLVDLLLTMLERGASDLHITAGARPAIRVNGELTQMDEYPVLTPPVIQRVMYAAITQRQREIFEESLELDFAYSVPGRARFRVNMYRQRDSVGAAFRIIPFEIKKLEDLGVPNTVANFAQLPRGFVLVTGPTGSGKSTTLASLLDLANRTRKEHIMTCEDPIEFLHRHQACLVNQREVGEDTKSFQNALKHVLRQDPDIILVGEMRDLETIGVALTAAETGHLVYATLHTQDAAQTIDRVIDVFPPHQQQQVRAQLAQAIQGVVCQTLARTVDGKGRVVACEVMVATPAIRNLIREGKTHQIYSAMQAGAKHGMQTMDQHLADLVNKGRITYETGVEKCHHIEDFNRLTGRG